MSRLDKATNRLEAALERLDQALASGGSQSGEDSEVWREALQRAETNYAVLEQNTDEVAQRLDGTIGRLRSLLES